MRGALVAATIAILTSGPSQAQFPVRPLPTAPRAVPISPAELEPFVDGVVHAAMARDHIAGVTVSIVQDGKVILKKGYGLAGDRRPVDPDRTLFRIGSISKTFTWIAAMKAVEAGRLRLDRPVNDYLPQDLAIATVPGWRPVEFTDLMSHSAGFEARMLDHMWVERPAQLRSLADKLKLNPPRRVFQPGTTPAYSNFGAMLAGEIVSRLAGANFPDVVDREITVPLGMSRTTFREPYPARADLPAPMPATLAADVSTGYHWTDGGLKSEPFEWISQAAPAGSASSTASDMARYMLMMLGDGELDGVRIYGPATAAAFRTPVPLPVPGGGEVDHGLMQTRLPGGIMGYGHDGDTLWFHSNLVTVPALRLGVFVSTNTDTGLQLAAQLPRLVVAHFHAAPPEPLRSGSPALVAERDVYEGTYLPNNRPFSGLEKFVFLMTGQSSIGVTPDGYLVSQSDGDPQQWAPTGRPGHFVAADGPQTLDFVLRDGKAVDWYPQGGVASFHRAGPLYQLNILLLVLGLAVAAAVVTLCGPVIRFRQAVAATRMQRRLGAAQLLAAGAWLVALGAGAVFAASAGNLRDVIFDWPGNPLLTASSVALVAAIISAGILLALPFAWRGDGGWGLWRKLGFSATSILFCLLGLQLAFWGFLEPWAP